MMKPTVFFLTSSMFTMQYTGYVDKLKYFLTPETPNLNTAHCVSISDLSSWVSLSHYKEIPE